MTNAMAGLRLTRPLHRTGPVPRTFLRAYASSSPPSKSTIDAQHSEFLASASHMPSAQAKREASEPSLLGETHPSTSKWTGKLSPTKTHLFKLLVPLPRSLSPQDRTSVPTTQTAFLLHPAQPLSFVSRLILGSLPASDRTAEVEFLAVSGKDADVYGPSDTPSPESQRVDGSKSFSADGEGPEDRAQLDSEVDEASKNSQEVELFKDVIDSESEGGPILTERTPDGGEFQEVRWSSSTDLGDFIKNATSSQSFRVVIKPEPTSPSTSPTASTSKPSTGEDQSNSEIQPLSLTIEIPSFGSRTVYLRKRLLWLTKEISEMTDLKKRTARRLASSGLVGLVVYWGVVCKLTFFTSLGWDVMEPITYLSGLSTVILGYLFFLYHNREVSYSSMLDISVSARQQKLYEQKGLDIERWTELVSEAKTLRKEIARIASDYNYDWRGQLENLGDAEVVRNKNKASDSPESLTPRQKETGSADSNKDSQEQTQARITKDNGDKVDIDATIDEASEEEEATRSKEAARKRGRADDGGKVEKGERKGIEKGKKEVGREDE